LQTLVDRYDPASRRYFSGKLACKMARAAPHVQANLPWTSRNGYSEASSLVDDLRS
jgi:hypothetical protein